MTRQCLSFCCLSDWWIDGWIDCLFVFLVGWVGLCWAWVSDDVDGRFAVPGFLFFSCLSVFWVLLKMFFEGFLTQGIERQDTSNSKFSGCACC